MERIGGTINKRKHPDEFAQIEIENSVTAAKTKDLPGLRNSIPVCFTLGPLLV